MYNEKETVFLFRFMFFMDLVYLWAISSLQTSRGPSARNTRHELLARSAVIMRARMSSVKDAASLPVLAASSLIFLPKSSRQ